MLAISRRKFLAVMPFAGVAFWFPDAGSRYSMSTRADTAEGIELLRDVRILGGTSGEVSPRCSARIDGGAVTEVEAGSVEDAAGARFVAGRGRTLIPGLVEAHWDACRGQACEIFAVLSPWAYLSLRTGSQLVPDVGVVIAPRVWPMGALCSATSSPPRRDPSQRLHSFTLRIKEGVVSICDPAGALPVADARALKQTASSGRWCSWASVHALTAKPIKAEIANTTRRDLA